MRGVKQAVARSKILSVLALLVLLVGVSACNLTSAPDETDTASEANSGGLQVAAVTATAPAGSTAVPAAECTPRADWYPYTIQPGDTLYDLGLLTDSSIEELAAGNCLSDPGRIVDGQTLLLPRPLTRGGSGTNASSADATLTTTVPVYAIAPDDNGASGVPVGCGDSGVVIMLSGSAGSRVQDNVRGSLEALFALGSASIGQSGLVNALADSDLTVQNVTFDGSEAGVDLTGRLALVGTCGDARMEAQLVLTVFQYAQVETALIRLNGANLRGFFDQSGLSAADFRYTRGQGILAALR